MINREVIEKLKSYGINVDNALTYLLSLYYNLKPDYIPELVIKQVNTTGILIRNYKKGIVEWTIPLFSDKPMPEHLVSKWDWVITEYRKMFMDIDPKKGGDRKSCIVKMKQFFAENPEVRKDDILEATKLYLNPFAFGYEDTTYMQQANYFISKMTKAHGTTSYESRLSEHIELLQLKKKQDEIYKHKNNVF